MAQIASGGAAMITPQMIQWAFDKANLSVDDAAKKLGLSVNTINAFLDGSKSPSYKQVSKIAKKLYIPFGYLFLPKPPKMDLPIPDFRTPKSQKISAPSLDLLDTVCTALLKQDWYSDFLKEEEEDAVMQKFTSEKKVEKIAAQIEDFLSLKTLRENARTYEEFLTDLMKELQKNNFIVMRNGIVGDNTHRPLKTEEFKGFALYDDYAPLIFINGQDYKSSQIFTLMHELAHIFLRESGVDNDKSVFAQSQLESKCNKIAAEILVPTQGFNYKENDENSLAQKYKVSTLVILIKAKQLNFIDENQFSKQRQKLEKQLLNAKKKKSSKGGGDFYLSKKYREGGDKFLGNVIVSAYESKTSFLDAYRLTGLSGESFRKYASRLGI